MTIKIKINKRTIRKFYRNKSINLKLTAELAIAAVAFLAASAHN